MASTKQKIRSVRNLRTLAGAREEGVVPHKCYMKLSTLELEKFRRNQERESALRRLRDIAQRFEEIEEEKSRLLQALNREPAQRAPASSGKAAPGRKSRRSNGGISFKY